MGLNTSQAALSTHRAMVSWSDVFRRSRDCQPKRKTHILLFNGVPCRTYFQWLRSSSTSYGSTDSDNTASSSISTNSQIAWCDHCPSEGGLVQVQHEEDIWSASQSQDSVYAQPRWLTPRPWFQSIWYCMPGCQHTSFIHNQNQKGNVSQKSTPSAINTQPGTIVNQTEHILQSICLHRDQGATLPDWETHPAIFKRL